MSFASALHSVENFFHSFAEASPEAAAAASSLSQAATQAEAALPSLANVGVNAVMNLVPAGPEFAPLADVFIDAVIAGLTAKKSAGA